MNITVVGSVPREDAQALFPIIQRFNAACNWLSPIAFTEKVFHWLPLQRRAYHELRKRFGVSAAEATVIVRKVAYAYKDKSRRDQMATFRPLGAVVLIQHKYHEGRVRIYGEWVSCQFRPGVILPSKVPQAVLVYRDRRCFIHQVVDVPELNAYQPQGFLGCDLGIVNILADSEGDTYSGDHINGLRKRHARLRARLQSRGTHSAKRCLRNWRRKESRFGRWMNHNISKQVVAKAERRIQGLALEDLQGIRERVRVRKAQRRQHYSWSFNQLRQFITYKAALAGVPMVLVNPKNTSRTCPACGLVDKANRVSQSCFSCVGCAFAGPADTIAAVNIGRRAAGNQPDADVLISRDSCESLHDGKGQLLTKHLTSNRYIIDNSLIE